ncbi:MAG: hypothetical protein IPO83_09945 [Chitinophagaceae bacterium]|nr:hypothetical protein [Chitinophagaceae bacterium]
MNYPHTRLFDEDWWYNDALAGPKALPGNYSVKLMTGDTLLMQKIFYCAESESKCHTS